MRRITDLHDSPVWRNPARLRLTPHESEIVDLVLSSESDQPVGKFGPTVNCRRRLENNFRLHLIGPGLEAATKILASR